MTIKTLGLGGIIPETRDWLADLFSALGAHVSYFEIREYRHWVEDRDADVAYEAGCLRELSPDLVIAKSLGTGIATVAFDRYNFRPRRAVFIGSPLKRHSRDDFGMLKNFVEAMPTLFIQQTSDKVGSFADLARIVRGYPNAIIVEVPGNDHVYADIEALHSIIEREVFPEA